MVYLKFSDIFAVNPSFDVPVVNITVINGKTAILPCSVDSLGDHKVVWTDQFSTLLTFDIQRIIDDDRIGVDRPYTKDWNLIIHDVRYSDKGRYICQINTKPVQTKSVELIVLVPPVILEDSSSNDVICREGETVTLTCNVTGVPTPTVNWYKRPLADGASHLKEKVGMNGEILIIHNVSRFCDGIYECVAYNDIPPAVNREMIVQVEFAPEIRLPNKRISQSVGRETILECIIEAFPQALSFWRYKGKELKSSHKHRIEVYQDGEEHQITLSLRIVDIRQEDFGKYVCHASNKLGSDREAMDLFGKKAVYFLEYLTKVSRESYLNRHFIFAISIYLLYICF
ncbi:hypothetical protein FSP39_020115 [Pinctada imbricata]|uniref:Ig-like domain-containing protein n=1 Tax=Pinctada imbricata TaxID=66713 RepID=A0AA89C243_PINIB|nr:hypothetical protein FSP39_020115 [Pinctada imbricata]